MKKNTLSLLPLAMILAACGGSADVSAPPTIVTHSSAVRASEAPADVKAYFDVLQKIYVGYFGRPADPAGLAFYANHYKNAQAPTDIVGMSAAYSGNAAIKALIDSFGTSAESQALYSGDNRAFVNAIYRNLFNRDADAAGLDFWARAIDNQAMTRASAALSIMGGAQTTDADGVTRKQQVASQFTAGLTSEQAKAGYSGMAANATVRTMLAKVDHTTSLAAFQPTIAAMIAQLEASVPQPEPSQAAAVTPLRSGGTVTSLLSAWSGTGFQLLSTAPPAPTWRPAPHAGSVWDNARQTLWVFGSETHGTDMDNAVYGWRASDGQFIKNYDADPKTDYRMDAAGVYWSSAEKVRPWAMHTYRRLRWVPGSTEFEVMYDPDDHAYVTPIFENAAHTKANRVPVMWYYDVTTGKWRHKTIGQSAKMVGFAGIFPMGYDSTYGWFTDDGAKWTRLANDGTLSTLSVYGKTNTQYHSFVHVKNGVAYRVGGNANVLLYSRHPLNDVAASTKFSVASYPALNGFTVTNMASAMMPDGRIVIFPSKGNETHAMILDPVANTVTATGHSFSGMDKPLNYDLVAEWSTAHNAVILLSRRFAQNRVYGYRP